VDVLRRCIHKHSPAHPPPDARSSYNTDYNALFLLLRYLSGERGGIFEFWERTPTINGAALSGHLNQIYHYHVRAWAPTRDAGDVGCITHILRDAPLFQPLFNTRAEIEKTVLRPNVNIHTCNDFIYPVEQK
jgi:hypothetical protein